MASSGQFNYPVATQGTPQLMPPQRYMGGYTPPAYHPQNYMQGPGQDYSMAPGPYQIPAQSSMGDYRASPYEMDSDSVSEASGTSKLIPVVEDDPRRVVSAASSVKEGLHNVKVSIYDATELQRKLEGELFDKWEERYEQMEATDIALSDINAFLDHLVDAYEGIDENLLKKMNGIKWSGHWSYKIYEFKYNKADTSGARYGMVAFGKSPDKKSIDCMYVLYKMDFKVAPQVMITKINHSALWGLIKWQTTETQTVERTLGVMSIKNLQNFFRVKALQRFYNEGLIDRINYVPSIEDIDTDEQRQ